MHVPSTVRFLELGTAGRGRGPPPRRIRGMRRPGSHHLDPSAGPAVDLPALVRQVEASVVTALTGSGVGSGIVYKSDGTILTHAHLVEGARQLSVAFADGRQVSAYVRAVDRATNVAVLHGPHGSDCGDVRDSATGGRHARRGHGKPAGIRGHGHLGHHLRTAPLDPRLGLHRDATGRPDPDQRYDLAGQLRGRRSTDEAGPQGRARPTFPRRRVRWLWASPSPRRKSSTSRTDYWPPEPPSMRTLAFSPAR